MVATRLVTSLSDVQPFYITFPTAEVMKTHFSGADRRARNKLVSQLFDDEFKYSQTLKTLYDLFVKPLMAKRSCVTPDEHAVLFGPVAQLNKLHQYLVRKWKVRLAEFPRRCKMMDVFAALKV